VGFTAVLLIALFLAIPHIIVLMLLVSRSCLDIFTDIGISIGPMMLNIPSITSIFIFIGGGLYLISRIIAKKNTTPDGICRIFIFWLVALLLWVVIPYFNFGIKGLVALREWIRLASLFIIYALTYHISQEIDYRRVVNYMFFALPVPLIVGLHQIITSTGLKVRDVNRIGGTIAHPSTLSIFLVLFIGLTIWKMRFSKNKIFWVILTVFQIVILVNTFSVCGMITFTVMIGYLFFAVLKARSRLALSVLAIATVAMFLLHPSGQKRIEEVMKTGNPRQVIKTGRGSGDSSAAWRMLNWTLLIKEWKKDPVIGFGLRMATDIVNPAKLDPHNDYLRFLVETGALGLSIFLIFIGAVGWNLWNLFRISRSSDPQFSFFVSTCQAIYTAWIVGSFSDNLMAATAFQYYFWAILGIAMGEGYRLSKEKRLMI
jgi:O-antigen ligase